MEVESAFDGFFHFFDAGHVTCQSLRLVKFLNGCKSVDCGGQNKI